MSFYDPAEVITSYCSGQCQASPYPASTCRCPICRGRLHGILRQRPSYVDVTAYPVREESYPSEKVFPSLPFERLRLPEIAQGIAHDLDLPKVQNRVSDTPTNFRPEIRRTSRGRAIGRRVARSLKHSLVGLSETELNERIIKGMKAQFSQENTDLAIDQAFQVFYSKNPDLPRPELYELYETGLIDKALEMMGKRWVIGRPKK